MTAPKWMLYGATGYTGQLVAAEAVRRGHRPLLAGRSADKLAPLAERLGLRYVAFPVTAAHPDSIAPYLDGIDVVYHAAGSFIHTSEPMLQACLQTRTHYLDITGEYGVFEQTYRYDEAAREAGISLISGVGFDVIPSDCLVKTVADQLPHAVQLDVGVQALNRLSAGTARSFIEMMVTGGRVRRDGQLVDYPFGKGQRQLDFPNGTFTGMVIPWGDVSTGYRTTGIPNITTYKALPISLIHLTRITAPIGQRLLRNHCIRHAAGSLIDRMMRGPSAQRRKQERAYVWARVTNSDGDMREAWLETVEAYQFTALAAVDCVEAVYQHQLTGALTPAQAFGADFVLSIPGTRRYDTLPD